MKTKLKMTVASFALVTTLGLGVGSASAADGMMTTQSMTPAQTQASMNQNAQLNVFLQDLAVFLGNLQTYVDNNQMEMGEPSTDTPAADLRVAMNNLFTEHVTISASVMRNIVDESDDLEGSMDAQMANAVEIAEAFGNLYGDDAQEAVAEAFLEHIEFSNEYAIAVDEMDEDLKDEANEELDEYLNDIAAILASVIDDLDEDTAYTVLREHEDLLNESIEQYMDGDYEEAYETEREAIKQIQGVTDVLSAGIVATMPEDF